MARAPSMFAGMSSTNTHSFAFAPPAADNAKRSRRPACRADLMREHQRIEMPEHAGELLEKLAGVGSRWCCCRAGCDSGRAGFGISSQTSGFGEKMSATACERNSTSQRSLPQLMHHVKKHRRRQLPALDAILQRPRVNQRIHLRWRQRRIRAQLLQADDDRKSRRRCRNRR